MRLRIVFLGSDTIALPALEWLAGAGRTAAEVVGVFTQPDRPVGRGQTVTANGIKLWALQHHVPVFQPERLTEEARLQLATLRPDLALVMAYGHILRDDFIHTPRLGTVNLHASLLPKYRGASPIQTAIASEEGETGVALMRIVRRLDAGPVADVERVSIEPLDTALEVERKISLGCVPLLGRNLEALAAGRLEFVPQDDAQATFCRRLTKDDGGLDFGARAQALAARINGLYPWPGCSFEAAGVRVKVGQADAVDRLTTASPGTVLAADDRGLLVAARGGAVRFLRMQRPGGKMLPAVEFLRGFSLAAGTVLLSETMAPLVAAQPFRK